jgi:hypothetical protein
MSTEGISAHDVIFGQLDHQIERCGNLLSMRRAGGNINVEKSMKFSSFREYYRLAFLKIIICKSIVCVVTKI